MANNHTENDLKKFISGLRHLQGLDWTAIVTNADLERGLLRERTEPGMKPNPVLSSLDPTDIDRLAQWIIRPELGRYFKSLGTRRPEKTPEFGSSEEQLLNAAANALYNLHSLELTALLHGRNKIAVVIYTDGDLKTGTADAAYRELSAVVGTMQLGIFALAIDPRSPTLADCLGRENSMYQTVALGESMNNAKIAYELSRATLKITSICSPSYEPLFAALREFAAAPTKTTRR